MHLKQNIYFPQKKKFPKQDLIHRTKSYRHKKNGSCSGYRFTLFKRWFKIGIVNRYKCINNLSVIENVWQSFGKCNKKSP